MCERFKHLILIRLLSFRPVCSAPTDFEQEGIFIVSLDLRLSVLIRKTATISSSFTTSNRRGGEEVDRLPGVREIDRGSILDQDRPRSIVKTGSDSSTAQTPGNRCEGHGSSEMTIIGVAR